MKNKKAVALVLAMFVLVFISLLVAAFLVLLTSDLMITSNHLGRLQALYVAEAGVEYAISQLRVNGDQPISVATTFPAGSGSSYTVTYPKSGTTRFIESIGQVDNDRFRAKIEARVSIKDEGSYYKVKIVSYQEKEETG